MFPVGTLFKDPKTLLPWASRFYFIRVILVGMVLAIIVVTLMFSASLKLKGFHVFLLLFGLIYPHLFHLLLGRFEGRRLRGNINLLIDGFFAGAVMPAIAFSVVPSLVIVVINLFNLVAIGGVFLAVIGAIAMLVGIVISGMFMGYDMVGSARVPEADILAFGLLLTYFFLVAWVVYRYAGALQRKCIEFQAQKNIAEIGSLRAKRALLAVLPPSVARELQAQGEVKQHLHEDATLLLAEFSLVQGQTSQINDLSDAFRTCDEIFTRHGLESVKTSGRRYLAIASKQSGPDEALSAAQEFLAFLQNHGKLDPEAKELNSVRFFIHCGSVEAGLVQVEKLNYDVVGRVVDEVYALSVCLWQAQVLVTLAARERLRRDWSLEPVTASGPQQVFALVDERKT